MACDSSCLHSAADGQGTQQSAQGAAEVSAVVVGQWSRNASTKPQITFPAMVETVREASRMLLLLLMMLLSSLVSHRDKAAQPVSWVSGND